MVMTGIFIETLAKKDDGDDKASKMLQIVFFFSLAYTMKVRR